MIKRKRSILVLKRFQQEVFNAIFQTKKQAKLTIFLGVAYQRINKFNMIYVHAFNVFAK